MKSERCVTTLTNTGEHCDSGMTKHLTQHIEGTGGWIKEVPEDFIVDEIPLYLPSDQGDHTYFLVEKKGIPTFEATRLIAKALNVRDKDIGYAGLKDARAITSQMMSVEHIPCEQVMALDIPGIQIHWARLHTNKLRIGHLLGNRFQIRIRGHKQGSVQQARDALRVLQERGGPNYFGPQRFGVKGDSHLIGKAILQSEWEDAICRYLGTPHPVESPQLQEARGCFDAGDWQQAKDLYPPAFHNEQQVLSVLMSSRGSYERAYHAIPIRLRRLFLSAYQSFLFNLILSERLPLFDKMFTGDLAIKHDNRAVFLVKDPETEQRRADRFEISPSGPLFGYKLKMPEGMPRQYEEEVISKEGVHLSDFRSVDGSKAKGARRSLRFEVAEANVVEDDEGLVVSFMLPKGSYASVVIQEITKAPLMVTEAETEAEEIEEK